MQGTWWRVCVWVGGWGGGVIHRRPLPARTCSGASSCMHVCVCGCGGGGDLQPCHLLGVFPPCLQCPTCHGQGDLDFSNPSFLELTGLQPDRVTIEW